MTHDEIPYTSWLIEHHGQATVMRIIFMIERLVGALTHTAVLARLQASMMTLSAFDSAALPKAS